MPEQPTPFGSRRKPEVVGRSPAVDLINDEESRWPPSQPL